MKGNGWELSNASGVKTGKISLTKRLCISSFCRGSSDEIIVDMDSGTFETGEDLLLPAPRLFAEVRDEGLLDSVQLLGRGHAIRRGLEHAFYELALETGDPYHEIFVEVVCKDCEELHPFEEGMALIFCFVKDVAVE